MYWPLSTARLLSPLALAVLSHAYTVIDDSNPTIVYSGNSRWLHGVNNTGLNGTRIFNGTVTHSICHTEDNCHVKIPFTGSGITVYIVVRQQLNFSCAVDGVVLSTFVQNPGDNCSVSDCYDHPVCNLQRFAYNNHMLDIAMFTNSAGASDSKYSDFFFDYALVNEVQFATTIILTQSSATPSPEPSLPSSGIPSLRTPSSLTRPWATTSSATLSSATLPSTSLPSVTLPSVTRLSVTSSVTPSFTSITLSSDPAESSTPQNQRPRSQSAVIGGALGAVVVIVAAIFALLCHCKRRRPNHVPSDIRPERESILLDSTQVLNIDPFISQPALSYGLSSTSLLPARIDAQQQTNASRSSILISAVPRPTTILTHTSPSAQAVRETQDISMNKHSTIRSPQFTETETETITPGDTNTAAGLSDGLTEQQVESIHGLIRHNVPAPVVASVIQRMLSSDGDRPGLSETDNPPSYNP